MSLGSRPDAGDLNWRFSGLGDDAARGIQMECILSHDGAEQPRATRIMRRRLKVAEA
jgi:hypothetical protein